VNDFSADAIISQLLLLDAQDSSKVRQRATLRFGLAAHRRLGAAPPQRHAQVAVRGNAVADKLPNDLAGHQTLHQLSGRVGHSRHGYL
jgi:hypothetical protein